MLPAATTYLLREVGCPDGLSAVGFSEANLPKPAEGGMEGSPRAVTQKDLYWILAESLGLW